MPAPSAVPVRVISSHLLLGREEVERLFGSGFRLRGTERVRLCRAGTPVATVAVLAGEGARLRLDRIDAAAGEAGGLRVQGPRGSLDGPEILRIRRRLILPRGLSTAWRLAPGGVTQFLVGDLLLGGVTVEAGDALALEIDRADGLAAGVRPGDAARWAPEAAFWSDAPAPDGLEDESPRRLITENDVRRARLQHRTIRVRPGVLITPAARSLGRELGVLLEE